MAAHGTLTVLVAPDSFKGSLTSVEAAEAIARGWRRARPGDRVELAPLADGGDGTLDAVAAGGGWSWVTCRAHDALGRAIQARWLRSAEGRLAIVELAEASGLARLTAGGRDERDALAANTAGTGEVICAVLDAGVRQLVLGIGGSATTDGGAGILGALGARVDGFDAVDLSGLDPRLAEVELRVACDVRNPLLGEHGASATYAPQKGASPDRVRELEARLSRWAEALEAAAGRRERDTPGAGAAGGVGFGLLSVRDRFRRFELRPGVELVMEETGFADRLAAANLAITGEGRIDAQTGFGKTAHGVAQRARQAGVRCVAIGGAVTSEGAACLRKVGCSTEAAAGPDVEPAEAMREAARLVADAAERVARRIEK